VSVKFFITNCGVILGKIRYNKRAKTHVLCRTLRFKLLSDPYKFITKVKKLYSVCNQTSVWKEEKLMKNRVCIYGLKLRPYKGSKMQQRLLGSD